MVLPMSRATRPASRLVPEVPLLRRSKQAAASEEVAVPAHFRCPISLELMRDPVTAPTGITYDRESLEGWLARGHTACPVTGRPVRLADLLPNHATRRMIQDWCVANRARGVERVPTPRVPLGEADAADAVAEVSSAARRRDAAACGVAAARARALGKESDQNRRCLAAAGAARALSAAFGCLAGERVEGAGAVSGAMGEILAALTVFFPLDDEARSCIASPASLKSLVSVMSHGELAARASAAIVLRELASSANPHTLDAVSKTPGMCGVLVGLVRNPVSLQATKAALVTAYYLVSASDRAAARLAELGAVPVVVELLVDADKGTSEKALAALDGVLCVDAGLAAARAHALVVPVLVKKMFRVSDMATEFAVSALWRLCRASEAGAAACRAEALRVGAFQKLLLLLQVGCVGVTKERASELLKMLNGSRGSVECIETVDFKGLKRPF
ncbi:U-box domain-containing protein 21-like [Phragmites australis]|uniref:U-box domain-containing protein 21-like n=1 Tax=Phragmites australis TaxID=29695 RepID=UPI002D77FC15|nr:U-box domain-containing protein 21-like [Phragmites australis]